MICLRKWDFKCWMNIVENLSCVAAGAVKSTVENLVKIQRQIFVYSAVVIFLAGMRLG